MHGFNGLLLFCVIRWAYTCAVSPTLFGSSKSLVVKMGLPCHSSYKYVGDTLLLYLIAKAIALIVELITDPMHAESIIL